MWFKGQWCSKNIGMWSRNRRAVWPSAACALCKCIIVISFSFTLASHTISEQTSLLMRTWGNLQNSSALPRWARCWNNPAPRPRPPPAPAPAPPLKLPARYLLRWHGTLITRGAETQMHIPDNISLPLNPCKVIPNYGKNREAAAKQRRENFIKIRSIQSTRSLLC